MGLAPFFFHNSSQTQLHIITVNSALSFKLKRLDYLWKKCMQRLSTDHDEEDSIERLYVRNNPKNQLQKMSPTTHRYRPPSPPPHTHTDTLTSSVQISTTFMPKQILHQFTLLSSMKCLSIALIFSLFSPHKPLFGYGYVLYLLWIHYHWTKIQLWNRKTTLNLCVSISLLQFASCLVQIRYRNVF